MTRRVTATAIAALLTVVGLAAIATDRAEAKSTSEPAKRLQTPVLSARRFPTALEVGADADLAAALRTYLDRTIGTTCAVVEVDGRIVHEHNPDMALTPASTIKLATALAALDVLGPDRTLVTTFRTDGQLKNGVVDGDLWVVGGGDPILTTKGYTSVFDDPEQTIEDFGRVADALRDIGVKRITGNIIGDDSRYDSVRWIPTWPQRYREGGTVSPLSALVVNDGSTGYTETPDAATTSRKAGDPPLLFAQTLRSVLVQRGIEVGGQATTGTAPSGSKELGSIESLPVVDLVAEMLTYSDNTTAELLTKEMGLVTAGAGTTSAGLAAIRSSLLAQGFDLSSVVMNDGSGLDTGDRASCRFLLDMVEHVAETPALSEALPVGAKTGTLRKRMSGVPSAGRVRAKTGTLNGVNTLAGFVDTTQGSAITFAFMHSGTDPRTTGVADGFTDRLVAYASKSPRIGAISPQPAR